eukprot:1019799-Prorocentrum_minimum.AAC.1
MLLYTSTDFTEVNLSTTSPSAEVPAVRGGLFCDDPGLGKTVTGLALILKTLGATPAPPLGAKVTAATDAAGRRTAFYTMTNPEPPPGAQSPGHHVGAQSGSPAWAPLRGSARFRSPIGPAAGPAAVSFLVAAVGEPIGAAAAA